MTTPVDRTGATGGAVMARLDRPRADEVTRLGVFADPHLSTRETGTSKLFERTETHLAATVRDADERDLDALVSAGDLTKDGEPWNYERVDEILSETALPTYAVPGNHDVPKEYDDHETPSVEWFADSYAPDGEYPFHERIGGVDLIGINTSGTASWLADTHEGAVREETIAWLDETLADAETPVVVAHHNLPAMAEQVHEFRDIAEPDMFVPPELRDPEPFVDVLARNDAPLVVTGHLHMPSAVTQRGVREIMAPTTCSFPQAYLLLEIGPDGTEVRMVPVADYEGTAVGYRERGTDSVTARGLTGMAATRLAQFPLIEDFRG